MEWTTTTLYSELTLKVSDGKEFMDRDELFTAVLTPRRPKSLRKVAEQGSSSTVIVDNMLCSVIQTEDDRYHLLGHA